MSDKKSTDQSASYHGEEAPSLQTEEGMPARTVQPRHLLSGKAPAKKR